MTGYGSQGVGRGKEAGMMDMLGRMREAAFGDTPSVLDTMMAYSKRQREFPNTQEGIAARLNDPMMRQLGGDIASQFAFAAPIKAYHGSPHVFDKFDMSRIGTGEGAQAYGHGLYFAENPAIAGHYRDALSAPTPGVKVGDEILGRDELQSRLTKSLVARDVPDDELNAMSARLELAKVQPPEWKNGQTVEDQVNGLLTDLRKDADKFPHLKPQVDWIENNWRDALDPVLHPKGGAMYEVQLAPDPEDLLDWDAPLSQQSEKVRAGLEKAFAPLAEQGHKSPLRPDMTGKDIYDALSSPFLGTAKDAPLRARKSARLREAGIPGLRYLDAGSRAGGEGSRNVVMFDDSLIDILSRNGLPVTR